MKTSRYAMVAALIFLAVILLSACQGDDGTGKDFYYPIPANPSRLDPQLVSGTAEDAILLGVMEGLVRIGEDGTIQPGVAEYWENEGRVYTFYLREGAKWFTNAGTNKKIPEEFFEGFDDSVTAQDFVFAFRRAVDPLTNSPLADRLYQIKNAREIREGTLGKSELGVRAVNKHTLEITLTQGNGEFLPSLAFAPFYPCSEAFFKATTGRYGLESEYLIYNGAFYLSRWREGLASVTLRQNPLYAGEKPVLPASVIMQIDSNTAQYTARLATNLYSATLLKTMDDLPSGATAVTIDNRLDALIFNCSLPSLKSGRVRAALTGVLDINALNITAQGAVPTSALVGEEKFRSLAGKGRFASISYSKGKARMPDSPLELTVLCIAEYESFVREILQQWNAAFGLNVVTSLEVLTQDELLNAVKAGNFTAAIYPLELRGQSPYSFLRQFASNSPDNIARFSSKTYDDLLDDLRGANDQKSTVNAARMAENHLMQNGVILPISDANSVFALGKGIQNVYFPFAIAPDFRSGLNFNKK